MRYTVVVIACEMCRTPGRRHARRNHGSQFSTHACRRAGVQSPWIFYGCLDSVVLLPEHYVYSLHAAVVHARHSLVGGNLSRSLMLRDVDNFTGIHHSSLPVPVAVTGHKVHVCTTTLVLLSMSSMLAMSSLQHNRLRDFASRTRSKNISSRPLD
jgi:hypothetical protein